MERKFRETVLQSNSFFFRYFFREIIQKERIKIETEEIRLFYFITYSQKISSKQFSS